MTLGNKCERESKMISKEEYYKLVLKNRELVKDSEVIKLSNN